MSTQCCNNELAALRLLEQAVRACGIPNVMVSGQRQLDMLSTALQAVVSARSVTGLSAQVREDASAAS